MEITLPETNIAPENGWLEYYVSFREGKYISNSHETSNRLESEKKSSQGGRSPWSCDVRCETV